MSFETEIPLSTCEGIHTVYLVDKPEKDDPKFHIVTASRKQLESFLGDQNWLLSRKIHLIEVFAGPIANLSKAVETINGNAIRIGLAYGQDLSRVENRALLLELVKFVHPEHVFVAWQCTSVAGFSQLNYEKNEHTRHIIDASRKLVGDWINMWSDIYLIQHHHGRYCHAENPTGSLAWLHPRVSTLPGLLFGDFDQCMYGLVSPRPPHLPHHKATTIATNSPQMQQIMMVKCNKSHQHEVLQGSYKGVSLTKTAENYPWRMAQKLVQAMVNESNCQSVKQTALAASAETLENKLSHKHTLQYLRQLHVALGHATPAQMAQALREAGASSWLIAHARQYQCPLCEAQKTTRSTPIVALAHARQLNECILMDFFFVKLKKTGQGIRDACIMSLLDEYTGLTQFHHISDEQPTSEAVIKALEQSWIPVLGAPRRIYVDEDRVFTSAPFARFCNRYRIVLEFAASGVASQHGLIENIHTHARRCIVSAYADVPDGTELQSLLVEVAAARNELSRHHSVSPNMMAFGQERRPLPHFGGGLDCDDAVAVESSMRHDLEFERMTAIRTAARVAYVKAEAQARLERVENHKSRGTHGPFQPGELVMVYRRVPLGKRRASRGTINPKQGFWYGPATVLAKESSDMEQLRPRLYYVSLFGRLYKCAEHQLRAMTPSAELARRRLQEFVRNGGVLQGNNNTEGLKSAKRVQGLDITKEAPDPDDVTEPGEDEQMQQEQDDETTWNPLTLVDPIESPSSSSTQTNNPAIAHLPETQPAKQGAQQEQVRLESRAETKLPILDVTPQAIPDRPEGRRKEVLNDFPYAALKSRMRSRSPNPYPQTQMRGRPEMVQQEPRGVVRPRSNDEAATETRKRAASLPPEDLQRKSETREQTPSDEEFTNLAEAFYNTPDHGYVKSAIEISFLVDVQELVGTLTQAPDQYILQAFKEALLTSQAKRNKVEVKERHLTAEEKEAFRQAKTKEWMSFVDNNVGEIAMRAGIDPQRIIGSRWVLTWKLVDGAKVPKARLVLLGYQDPDLGEYTRSSPTLTRTGRTLVLALMAQFVWQVFSLDAKNAFLAGDISSRSKPLYMQLPKDLLEMMQLPADSVYKLRKSAYGLAEAPIAWFRCLRSKLENLNWKAHPLDECVMTLYDPEGSICGLMGIHVDDLLVGGCGPYFEGQMKQLETDLPFGARKYGSFVYTGIQITQTGNGPITIDQCHYIDNMEFMPCKHLSPNQRLHGEDVTRFKALCGSLAWAAIHTRPDKAFDVSWLASRGKDATQIDVKFGNSIMRSMKQYPLKHTFTRISEKVEDWRIITFHDAGWATRQSLHSQAGATIFMVDKSVLDGKRGGAMMVEWMCSKIPRVVRSSFEAEINSAQMALDTQEYVEAMLMIILHNLTPLQWRKMQYHLPSALVGDNKGLYTAVMSANPISTKGEKRLTLEKMILKDHLKEYGVRYCWTNAGHQLADCLTKLSTAGARSDLLTAALEQGVIQIIYSTQSGRKESQQRTEEHVQLFSLDDDQDTEDNKHIKVDELTEWYYDLQ